MINIKLMLDRTILFGNVSLVKFEKTTETRLQPVWDPFLSQTSPKTEV
jgi:hypothetical protein